MKPEKNIKKGNEVKKQKHFPFFLTELLSAVKVFSLLFNITLIFIFFSFCHSIYSLVKKKSKQNRAFEVGGNCDP